MYIIKRYNHPVGKPNTIYEQFLSKSGEFCIATNTAIKFSTIAHAVDFWGSHHTNFHKPDVWIEGPKGGRYNPITGGRLR